MTNLLDYSPLASELQTMKEVKEDLGEMPRGMCLTPEVKKYIKDYVVTKRDLPDIQLNWNDNYFL